jgi:hypothetical protein
MSYFIKKLTVVLPLQRAEILRLRLGLASYKVRTGQTDVPLEDLVCKPLPRDTGVPDHEAPEEDTERNEEQLREQEQQQQQQQQQHQEEEVMQAVLPPLPEVREDTLPVVGDEDARRRLQGEAMNGLLSLARSGSDG